MPYTWRDMFLSAFQILLSRLFSLLLIDPFIDSTINETFLLEKNGQTNKVSLQTKRFDCALCPEYLRSKIKELPAHGPTACIYFITESSHSVTFSPLYIKLFQ